MTQHIDNISTILDEAQIRKVRGKKARSLYAYLGVIASEWHELEDDPSQQARDRQAELWGKVAKVKHFPMCMDMAEYSAAQSIGQMSCQPDGNYIDRDREWEIIQADMETPSNSPDHDDEIPF